MIYELKFLLKENSTGNFLAPNSYDLNTPVHFYADLSIKISRLESRTLCLSQKIYGNPVS